MNRSHQVLELDKILIMLGERCESRGGLRLAEELGPIQDREELEAALLETEDALAFIEREGEVNLHPAEDISDMLRYAEAGAVPSLESFLKLGRVLRLLCALRSRVPKDSLPGASRFVDRLAALPEFPLLLAEIERCILNEEDLHDRASLELYQIRRSIQRAQESIKDHLQSILKRQAAALQDTLVTLRGDRYVLPVKAEHRQTIPGLVHDASSSGQTLFIEPFAVVEKNNQIRELKVKEREEIERILKAMAEQVAEVSSELKEATRALSELDFCQAKGRLARQMRAIRPSINAEGRMRLIRARHPLIPAQKVVPIDLELGYRFNCLIITGPNTGGKTVSLKTCALLSLMAQCGLLIPASSGSEVAVFKKVLADIGDEQSIEQNLSTFSAHIRQIIDICEEADAESLVVLDELGAGTDPSEGAALAIAILDHLRQKGASLLATTHYQELKAYALNEPGVSNACSEFDTESLRPTYRLLIGVPGVSNALLISTRLGLPQGIVEHAKSLLNDEGARFEDLLQAIRVSHDEAEALENELKHMREELEEGQRDLERQKAALEAERARLMAEAEAKAEAILDDAQAEVSLVLEEIQTKLQAEDIQAARKTALQMRNELQESRSKRQKRARDKALKASVKAPLREGEIQIGRRYRAPALGIQGEAIALEKDQVLLRNGPVQVRVPIHSLQAINDEELTASKSLNRRGSSGPVPLRRGFESGVESARRKAHLQARSELKLLGMKVDEALIELDRYLDEAVLAGLDQVRIVHGKGTGALRSAVQKALQKDRRVRSFEQAAYGQGDAGVTVAHL